MRRRTPRFTRTDTLFPYTTLCRAEMPIGHRTSEPVDVRERDGIIGLARLVQACCFIEQAVRTALGARSVVAFDEEDERVVEFPGALDLVEHPADLIVGIGDRRGISLHHPRIEPLLDRKSVV